MVRKVSYIKISCVTRLINNYGDDRSKGWKERRGYNKLVESEE